MRRNREGASGASGGRRALALGAIVGACACGSDDRPAPASAPSSRPPHPPGPTCAGIPSCIGDTYADPCSVETPCPRGCQERPGHSPRCAPDIAPPAAVVEVLETKPYVEERCSPAEGDGVPGGALRCRYAVMGIDAEVVVHNPDPERVAGWIVDASAYAPVIERLYDTDRAAWEQALVLIARHTRNQSSRIFPVSGEVVEQLDDTPKAYRFDRGVVTPCEAGGCACRINSLKPAALCNFRAAMRQDGEACRRELGGPRGDAAWRAQCQKNHEAAIGRHANEHYRAALYDLGRRIDDRCAPRGGCNPAEVVGATRRALRL